MTKGSKKLRDNGMALAVRAQDEYAPKWSDRAYAALWFIARTQRSVHIDDILRDFAERPGHPNAWGSVWMRAIRNGLIARTGEMRNCRLDARKHHHNYPVYESLVY